MTSSRSHPENLSLLIPCSHVTWQFLEICCTLSREAIGLEDRDKAVGICDFNFAFFVLSLSTSFSHYLLTLVHRQIFVYASFHHSSSNNSTLVSCSSRGGSFYTTTMGKQRTYEVFFPRRKVWCEIFTIKSQRGVVREFIDKHGVLGGHDKQLRVIMDVNSWRRN